MEDALVQVVVIGSLGLFALVISIIFFVIRSNNQILKLEVEKQRELIDAEITSQEQERQRIARELHDAVGADITGVKLRFENMVVKIADKKSIESDIPKVEEAFELMSGNVRRISQNLLAHHLESYGLVYSIKALFEQHSSEHFQAHLVAAGDVQLPGPKLNAIYRLIQEIMNNALKHSKPTQFTVQITMQEQQLQLDIRFDGELFDFYEHRRADGGVGLKNIESRVQYLKGDLSFDQVENQNHYLLRFPYVSS